MSTDAGNLSTVTFAAVNYVKFGAVLVLGNILRGDVRRFILDSIVYHIVVRKANVPQHIVVLIEEQRAAFFESLHDFKLCFFDVFPAAKVLYMAGSYAGNHCNIRPCGNGKLADFTRPHHSEFKHHSFHGGVKLQYGFWNAHLVIEVIFCFKRFIFALYHRSYHLSGGGFAHAAGNGNHHGIKFASVKPRYVKESLTGGFYEKQLIRSVIALFLHYGKGCAFFHGGFYEGVTVEFKPAKRNK